MKEKKETTKLRERREEKRVKKIGDTKEDIKVLQEGMNYNEDKKGGREREKREG